jgi:UDP-N-acetylglucosamine acyltransferase
MSSGLLFKNIHPSAQISPLAVIEDGVEIGENTKISEFVIIRSGVKIGSNCTIYPHAVIGEAPQDRSYKGEESFITIGDNNVIREFVTIHKPVGEGTFTRLGSNCFLMAGSHLGHNCQVGSNVTMANNVALGGHVIVEDFATIGGGAVVHQHCRVGKMVMLAGMSASNHDAIPFMVYMGIPSGGISTNRIGLKRAGFDQSVLSEIMRAYKIIYKQKSNLTNLIQKLEDELQPIPEIVYIKDFIKNTKRGIILKRFTHGEDA